MGHRGYQDQFKSTEPEQLSNIATEWHTQNEKLTQAGWTEVQRIETENALNDRRCSSIQRSAVRGAIP
ncbi:hypothetical protein T265_03318 [Opisthorchis viverrini]|uniref:Uncharacterized protein n=1 Tax=Opisthorchis viverrini TaxID=6198 RepID=A0A075AHM8_OPIVI|nr:hypothetical protein T265_03318 [Opisthorchis viverrini]KER30159.1 hypothetical protein T265_03318 [Opisthorchis viverrini]